MLSLSESLRYKLDFFFATIGFEDFDQNGKKAIGTWMSSFDHSNTMFTLADSKTPTFAKALECKFPNYFPDSNTIVKRKMYHLKNKWLDAWRSSFFPYRPLKYSTDTLKMYP